VGNHILNRVPPTETRGRVHTSVLTVAVLDHNIQIESEYNMRSDSDYMFEIFKSSGPGGQNRNKVSSGVKCIHIPTGIKQERTTKCQHSNKKMAREAVDRLLDEQIDFDTKHAINTQRTDGIGSGSRGSKVRMYKFQEGVVINITTGKRMQIKQFFKGKVNKLWD